jgi:RNA recognition motif-containing protein
MFAQPFPNKSSSISFEYDSLEPVPENAPNGNSLYSSKTMYAHTDGAATGGAMRVFAALPSEDVSTRVHVTPTNSTTFAQSMTAGIGSSASTSSRLYPHSMSDEGEEGALRRCESMHSEMTAHTRTYTPTEVLTSAASPPRSDGGFGPAFATMPSQQQAFALGPPHGRPAGGYRIGAAFTQPTRPATSMSTANMQQIPRIFVGKLASTTSSESIRSYFENFLKNCGYSHMYASECISDVYMPMDHSSGRGGPSRSRGFAFVSLRDPACVDMCMRVTNHFIDGKRVVLDVAAPRGIKVAEFAPLPQPRPAANLRRYGDIEHEHSSTAGPTYGNEPTTAMYRESGQQHHMMPSHQGYNTYREYRGRSDMERAPLPPLPYTDEHATSDRGAAMGYERYGPRVPATRYPEQQQPHQGGYDDSLSQELSRMVLFQSGGEDNTSQRPQQYRDMPRGGSASGYRATPNNGNNGYLSADSPPFQSSMPMTAPPANPDRFGSANPSSVAGNNIVYGFGASFGGGGVLSRRRSVDQLPFGIDVEGVGRTHLQALQSPGAGGILLRSAPESVTGMGDMPSPVLRVIRGAMPSFTVTAAEARRVPQAFSEM